ncbi:tigger transposable element-derived protein 4 [Trichonephila inaurata madagascariensis]|uniref:Tigger transposable element-derived protein 4 n=1 Tax=Trichonephila inaurata madagascariensis TaxID=2747483 RepID=A0A8X6Y637_9ARAC|nr:tigger transposable element-derived protein 4 [Trichonephila inaurata madagascariensis]
MLVFYLLPNTTSKLQLMDQGNTKNFKLHSSQKDTVISYLYKYQFTDYLRNLENAWSFDVTNRTIRNSLAKAGFFVSSESSACMGDEDNIPLEQGYPTKC